MDPIVTFNEFVSRLSSSPASLQNESGYGSMGRVLHSPIQDSDVSDYKECSFTCATDTGYGKRTLNANTIKRKLFTSSPYESAGKQLQLSLDETPVRKINQKISNVTEQITDKLHVETPIKALQTKCLDSPVAIAVKNRNVERSPFKSPLPVEKTCKEPQPKCAASPSIKFYYTPVKNGGLFRNPTPSPLRSVVPETIKAPSSEWVAFDLPEKRRDMLKKLFKKNMKNELSRILSMLSDRDIFRIGCVSRTWRKIVESDIEARKRRKNYMRVKNISKENRRIAQYKELILGGNFTDGDREILKDLCNRRVSKPSVSNLPKSKSECFFEVAKSIPKSEVILKCPMCQYPAKCVIGKQFQCTQDSCSYEFCRQCLGSHTHTVACPAQDQSIPKVIIGSKKSKRNLRRL